MYNFYMIDVHTSLYNFMRDYRKKQDDSVALVRGGRKMRFEKLFREIDRVAGGLYKLGVRKGDVVMLALPNIEQRVLRLFAYRCDGIYDTPQIVCGRIFCSR